MSAIGAGLLFQRGPGSGRGKSPGAPGATSEISPEIRNAVALALGRAPAPPVTACPLLYEPILAAEIEEAGGARGGGCPDCGTTLRPGAGEFACPGCGAVFEAEPGETLRGTSDGTPAGEARAEAGSRARGFQAKAFRRQPMIRGHAAGLYNKSLAGCFGTGAEQKEAAKRETAFNDLKKWANAGGVNLRDDLFREAAAIFNACQQADPEGEIRADRRRNLLVAIVRQVCVSKKENPDRALDLLGPRGNLAKGEKSMTEFARLIREQSEASASASAAASASASAAAAGVCAPPAPASTPWAAGADAVRTAATVSGPNAVYRERAEAEAAVVAASLPPAAALVAAPGLDASDRLADNAIRNTVRRISRTRLAPLGGVDDPKSPAAALVDKAAAAYKLGSRLIADLASRNDRTRWLAALASALSRNSVFKAAEAGAEPGASASSSPSSSPSSKPAGPAKRSKAEKRADRLEAAIGLVLEAGGGAGGSAIQKSTLAPAARALDSEWRRLMKMRGKK